MRTVKYIAEVHYTSGSAPEIKLFLTWWGLKRWLTKFWEFDTVEHTTIQHIDIHGMALRVKGPSTVVSARCEWPTGVTKFEQKMEKEFGYEWKQNYVR